MSPEAKHIILRAAANWVIPLVIVAAFAVGVIAWTSSRDSDDRQNLIENCDGGNVVRDVLDRFLSAAAAKRAADGDDKVADAYNAERTRLADVPYTDKPDHPAQVNCNMRFKR